MKQNEIVVSTLPKTWIIDLDGTLLKHNGYLIDGKDTLLPKSIDFLKQIPPEDYILLLTARSLKYQEQTLEFLKNNNIKYDKIIFEIPPGERVLINDCKPSGL